MMAVISPKASRSDDVLMEAVLLCAYCLSPSPQGAAYCCEACRLLSSSGWAEEVQNRPLPEAYAGFENEDLRAQFEHSADDRHRQYRIYIEGLQCSSCVHLLEGLPDYLPGVVSAELRFGDSELRVRTLRQLGLGRLLSFIASMGYKPRPLSPTEDSTAALREEDRALLRRIAVSGAAAGNIMLFTIPIYAGLTGALKEAFTILSFLLFIPVLTYSALPIYKSAIAALKNQRLNVDVALSLAFVGGFLASAFNALRGSDAIYLDSSAGFLFLILVSRWFLKNTQRRWIQSPLTQLPWMNAFRHLQPGDGFRLRENACVPVDAVLESPRALFDASWTTGEALPQVLQQGMQVPAGFRLLSDEAGFCAQSTTESSTLSKGLRRIEQDSLTASRRMNVFDKAAQWLLSAVFLLSLVMVIAGPAVLGLSLEAAFERALSLLIVACPCALAFGGPLAYAMTLRRAADHGLLIKSADTLDFLLDCKTLVFDKTGTLTLGQLEMVRQTPPHLPEWMKDLILGLESHSRHPVAAAFRRAWSDHPVRTLDVSDVHEVPGEKIFGVFDGQIYSLQKANESGGGIKIHFKRENECIATFEFEDELRPESEDLLRRFARSFQLRILSGDRDERVQQLIARLQVPGLTGRGDQTPEDKARAVREDGRALMIGDGANDAEALASAHVGVAVSGSLEVGLRSAAVYLVKPGLRPLAELFRFARRARHLVHRNLSFALAYNIGAGLAALCGFVGPLTAALLMPISSLLILFSTWEASR